METLEIRYTPGNRWLRPLVLTFYILFLAATLTLYGSEANRWAGALNILAVLLTLVAIRTWWYAWSFRIRADDKGITQSGGLVRQHALWREIQRLDIRREGEFRSDASKFRPLQSITLIGQDGILMQFGHDLRCVAADEREQLLQFIQQRVDAETIEPHDELEPDETESGELSD